jgi:hypothetical protein
MTSSITNFYKLNTDSRNNRFQVIITYPSIVGAPDKEDYVVCKAAALPESEIGIVNYNFRGRTIPMPGDATYAPWTVTMYNDAGFGHRNRLEAWHNAMNNHEGNIQSVNNVSNLLMNIDVIQLDRNDRPLSRYKLIGAFPSSVGPIQLDYAPSEEPQQFEVTFTYAYWEKVGVTS